MGRIRRNIKPKDGINQEQKKGKKNNKGKDGIEEVKTDIEELENETEINKE
jgi:hypothetical protein